MIITEHQFVEAIQAKFDHGFCANGNRYGTYNSSC
jgi:hypothetical protein